MRPCSLMSMHHARFRAKERRDSIYSEFGAGKADVRIEVDKAF